MRKILSIFLVLLLFFQLLSLDSIVFAAGDIELNKTVSEEQTNIVVEETTGNTNSKTILEVNPEDYSISYDNYTFVILSDIDAPFKIEVSTADKPNDNYLTDIITLKTDLDEPIVIEIVLNDKLEESLGDNAEKMYLYYTESNEWNRQYNEIISNDYGIVLDKEISFAFVYDNLTFPDIQNHWAKNDIEILAARYIVEGYPSGEFKPQKNLTRAEFVKLLMNEFYTPENLSSSSPEQGFNDTIGHWGEEYINSALNWGIINGSNGKFDPNGEITREEMVAIVIRALKKHDPSLVENDLSKEPFYPAELPYTDYNQISPWAIDDMKLAYMMGLIEGVNEDELDPKGKVTRAQASVVLLRYIIQVELK